MKIYTIILYPFYKTIFFRKKKLLLHIGSGKNKIPNWINVDGNPFCNPDLLIDIRNRLPFIDNSVKVIFTVGTLEHFYFDEIVQILKEFHRVMDFGGILRIVVPDLEMSINAYLNNQDSFFSNFPKKQSSIGGKFNNFIFCDGQHKIAFDFGFMSEILEPAGFKNINKSSFNHSLIDKILYSKLMEYEECHKNNSLFIEAIKSSG